MEAAARFLRALAYYNLAVTYGDVPLKPKTRAIPIPEARHLFILLISPAPYFCAVMVATADDIAIGGSMANTMKMCLRDRCKCIAKAYNMQTQSVHIFS